jgi:preprotein translocase subunit SecG
MSNVLIILHVVVSFALILIVLLQTGKGADMGAAFGGGSSQTLFGSAGASTFLGKLTTIAAVVFMLTSLALAYISTGRGKSSIMMDAPPPMTDEALPQSGAAPPAAEQTPAAESSQQEPSAPAAEPSTPPQTAPADTGNSPEAEEKNQ